MKKYLLVLYLTALFLPQSLSNYDAADVIGTQWLFLSISLIFSVTLASFFIQNNINDHIFSNIYFRLVVLFYTICTISLFWSENIIESIFVLGRLFVIPLHIILFLLFLKNSENIKKISSTIVVLFLTYELYLIYQEFFYILKYTEYNFDYAVNLKGVTGNKNIAAASIAVKVPFLFYVFQNEKNNIIRSLSLIIISLSSFAIVIISSRAILLALLIITTLFIAIIVTKKGLKNNLHFISISLLIPLFLSQFILDNSSNSKPSERLNSIVKYRDSESANIRLRYYSQGIKHILNNPIMGCGIGNWKIKSIDYDSKTMREYVVPYNLHNDFLEIAAELGIPGLIPYLLLFLLFFIKYIKELFGDRDLNLWRLVLFLSLTVYFVDANLNFPMQRVAMTTMFIFLVSLIIFDNSYNKTDVK